MPLWTVSRARRLASCECRTARVSAVAFSHSGRTLACSRSDGRMIRFWNMRAGRRREGAAGAIAVPHRRPTGGQPQMIRRVAAGLRQWHNCATGRSPSASHRRLTASHHDRLVVAFSPDEWDPLRLRQRPSRTIRLSSLASPPAGQFTARRRVGCLLRGVQPERLGALAYQAADDRAGPGRELNPAVSYEVHQIGRPRRQVDAVHSLPERQISRRRLSGRASAGCGRYARGKEDPGP